MLTKKDINHVFQPVVSSQTEKIVGFEALLRHERISNPVSLFREAREQGLHTQLDMLSIEKALETFRFQHVVELLFINIFPTTLLNMEFKIFLKRLAEKYSSHVKQIVFELNETAEEKQIWNKQKLKEMVALIRGYGFRIAIDDVGVGAASLKQVIEFNPDMIKLDRYFSNQLAVSNDKQEVLSFFVDYCRKKNKKLILEGIETKLDFEAAKALHVPYLQGYYIGKPNAYANLENRYHFTI